MNLYHYCTNANFVSIISTKEIWSSEFTLSNDRMEGLWIREIFKELCEEKSVSPSDQKDLLTQLDAVIALAGGAGFCMSEEGDLLSQWRAYADHGAGISIGFNKEYLDALGELKRDRSDEFNASLTKVEYDIQKQKKVLAEHFDEILRFVSEGALRKPTLLSNRDEKEWQQTYFSMSTRFIFFFFHIFSLKNPAFVEEKEWRVISHLIRGKRDGGGGAISKMEFRGLVDRIVPFVRIKLESLSPIGSIQEVVLGPKNITPEEVVEGLMKKFGWADVIIRRSKASFR